MNLELKRVYDIAPSKETYRVLVDRLWPRGISKKELELDYWPKSLCPSDELRKWFHEDKNRWEKFCEKYRNELAEKESEMWDFFDKIKSEDKVSLLYATKDEERNHAKVLKEVLEYTLTKE